MPRAKRMPNANNAEIALLAKMLNFSVLLLDRDLELKFASGYAHELFGSADTAELTSRWRDCFDRLQLPDLPRLEKNSKPLRHRIDLQTSQSTRRLRMEIYPLRHGDCECYVMLLKDREVMDGLEQQLVLASYLPIQRYIISTLVHDLNAPINTLRITLELIDRTTSSTASGAPSDFVNKWERYKGILREELGKLKTLVADIPDVFSYAENEIPLAFDIRSVIKDVEKFLKHETTSKQIRRELLLSETPIIVHGSQIELRLALLNLVCALLEATKQGGSLCINAFSTEFSAEIVLRADQAQLSQQSVHDYEQLAFVPKERGIGLFVARLLVEAQGGKVEAAILEEGQSARIRVLLPLFNPLNEPRAVSTKSV
ncbi:MAG: hypothetical protein M3Q00_06935 [Pseudomonadota bacterium]|nr:hypothetical protein [Pseudomonadota bacterium]